MLAFSSKRTKINRVLLLSFFNYIEYIAGIGIVITATVSTAGFNLQICENVLVLFAFHFPLFLRQIWYWFRRVVESILCPLEDGTMRLKTHTFHISERVEVVVECLIHG